MVTAIPTISLHDGNQIPVIGLGTYDIRGNMGATAIANAIELGYSLIDTAYKYENEGAVGQGIKRSSVPREQIQVASKLPGRYHSYKDADNAIQESLYRASLDYFDLYLIHWPNPKQGKFVEACQALIDAQKWGLIRSIGVSNFLPEHLERFKEETGILPTVNQIELHPFFNQEEQRQWHENNGIVTESWSPLYRGHGLLGDKTLQDIAKNHGKPVSQIVLRWHYQLGAVVIPKSSSPQRQFQNLSIFDFELTEDDMKLILLPTSCYYLVSFLT
ncbi:aldo/keto reductase [Bacillus sp. JCM 19034]|uniref:aldo/keto reductase n=1 Tax=Bacillus sp. JCM 19034 TaxID=1481928 RepID=UPI0007817C5D|nr:aldo/keto reductase [Bacillus sp. JCM 19034]